MASHANLLFVEDDEEDYLLALDALRDFGFAVESVRTAERGELIAALGQGGWDLVIADCRLPSFNGVEALLICRERDPLLPVVFVSGTVGEEAAAELMRLGGRDFVLKGNIARLGPVVEREIEESRRHRALAALEAETKKLKGELSLATEAQQRMVFALESIPASISLYDPQERLVHANSHTYEMFRGIEDVLQPGKTWEERCRAVYDRERLAFEPGKKEEKVQELLAAFRNPPPFREYHRNDGRWIRALDRKTPDGHTICLRYDITDIREKEAALQAAGAKIRQLVEYSLVGVLVHRNFKPLFANSAFARLFGYPSVEGVMGIASTLLLIPPEERPAISAMARARLKGADVRPRYESRGMRLNGEVFWMDVSSIVIDWDGAPAILSNYMETTESKLLELQLRKSEARIRSLIERADLPLVVHRDFKPLLANEAYARLFGYQSVEEVLALPNLFGTMDSADVERMRAGYSGRMSGNLPPEPLERYVVRPDGTARWIEIIGTRIEWEGEPALFVACIDLTARKQAEEALARSETRFRGLIEHTGIPMLVHRDFHPLFVNDAFARLFGFESREYVLGLDNIHSTFLPEDRDKYIREISAWRKRNEATSSYERRASRADGSEFWIHVFLTSIEWEGEPVILASYIDITARKQAEEELRASQQMLRTVFDTIPAAVTVRDLDGRFLMVNRVAADDHGAAVENFEGHTHGEVPFGTAEERATIDAQIRQVTETGKEVTAVEFPLTLADGKTHVFLSNRVPLKDAQGNMRGIVSVSQDVTESRNLRDQLNVSQRMEAIGRLAGGVAHDFNNMLAVITSFSGFVLDKLPEQDEMHADVLEIQHAAERAAGLTRQLLAFSRRQVQKLQVISLNTVLGDLNKMLGRLIGEDIQLEYRLIQGLWPIKADVSQIEQVVLNLVVNARDAMPKGGSLTIETANRELREDFAAAHLGASIGSYVALRVTDTGMGMDPATQQRIFEPFFTTKEKGKGTGLGLATVYGIVKQSGGGIWVRSELNVGTTFEIFLPRVDEAVTASSTGTAARAPKGAGTILLVEDEDIVRRAAKRILEQAGYSVIEAPGGDVALALAATHPAPIELMVSDVIMPKMGGRELADRIAITRPGIKVLFMSGYTDDSIVHHGVLEGGVHFLQKPFTRDALLKEVRDVLTGNAPDSAP